MSLDYTGRNCDQRKLTWWLRPAFRFYIKLIYLTAMVRPNLMCGSARVTATSLSYDFDVQAEWIDDETVIGVSIYVIEFLCNTITFINTCSALIRKKD